MRFAMALGLVVSLAVTATVFSSDEEAKLTMYPEVEAYLRQRSREFDKIPSERKAQLEKISVFVTSRVKAGKPAKLTFICTHNSRRSHMSQIWAATAARFFGVKDVETFSGGTEATAFNPRAVAAMERAGLKIEKSDDSKNPCYSVRYQESNAPLICFSKVYADAPNPKDDFCAIMTCSQADKYCPLVHGCSLRVAVPYEDPKIADGTPAEAAKYDERRDQICREMMFLFSQVRN